MSNYTPHTIVNESLLNGYKISFSLKNSMIIIEAKNSLNSKLYSVNIKQSETAKLTAELFSDIESLYDSLIAGINKTDSSIKVSMTEDAILYCSFETLIGKNKKTLNMVFLSVFSIIVTNLFFSSS